VVVEIVVKGCGALGGAAEIVVAGRGTVIIAAAIAAAVTTAAHAAATAATAATAIAPADQRQFTLERADNDFSRVAIGAALVLPFAGGDRAFDVNFAALAQLLLRDLADVFVANDNVVPFSFFPCVHRTACRASFPMSPW